VNSSVELPVSTCPTASQDSVDTAKKKQTRLRHLTQAANNSNRRKFNFGILRQCFHISAGPFFSHGQVYAMKIEDSDDEDDMESQNEDDEPSRAFEEQGLNSEIRGKGAL
jgi:hypothetical protein